MKVLLLNSGGHVGMDHIQYPVVVYAERHWTLGMTHFTYHVPAKELGRIGARMILHKGLDYLVFIDDEVEEL